MYTTIETFGVSKIWRFKFIKRDSEDINVTKDLYFKKIYSLERSIQRIMKKKQCTSFHNNIKQYNCSKHW